MKPNAVGHQFSAPGLHLLRLSDKWRSYEERRLIAVTKDNAYNSIWKLGSAKETISCVSVGAFFDGPLSKDFDGLPTSASRAL
jgi:hypothetical protein